MPKEELKIDLIEDKDSNVLIINTTRDFFLVTKNIDNNQYILSIKRLDYIRAWKRIKQIYSEDIIFYLKIKHRNKGGIVTYLEGIQGFIPKSHLIIQNKEESRNFIDNYKIKCKLLSFNEHRNQLILSNKSANLSTLNHKFKIGELVYGQILKQKQYGIFLNIYNIRVLLHISEMNFKLMKEDKHSIELGQFIKVKIIYINLQEGLISASMRNVKYGIIPPQQY